MAPGCSTHQPVLVLESAGDALHDAEQLVVGHKENHHVVVWVHRLAVVQAGRNHGIGMVTAVVVVGVMGGE